MRRESAEGLVQLLADAYRKKLDPGTTAVYVTFMERLGSTEVAFEAAKDIIANSDTFPPISQIRATYQSKAGRAAELAEGQERRALEEEIVRGKEGLPVMVAQFLAKLEASSTDIVPAKVLVETEPGVCDDCGKPTEHRYAYGSFQLDALCASKRMAVRIP